MSSVDQEDLFQDFDASVELDGLISKTMGTDRCSADEYVNGDNNLPICVEFKDETWDDRFLECLAQSKSVVEEEESDTEELDLLPPPPKIKNCKEAMESLEEVKNFLESRDCFTEASTAIDQVAWLHSTNTKQMKGIKVLTLGAGC